MVRCAAVLLAALAAAVAAPPADAQTGGTTVRPQGALVEPESYDRPPRGRSMTAREALRIAAARANVREALKENPRAYARAYLAQGGRWQVSWFLPPTRTQERREEIAQVLIRDRDRRVLEAWTGVQVEWPMARGYPGQFGRAVNAPWVWIGLCVLFVLPFARPPLRLLHLDLAVLLAFSVSYAFFGAADLDVSVPSAYPLLAYVLVRMVVVARRPPAPPPRLLTGPAFLLLAIAFLAAFRVALNVADGNVIDVGYASVIGADRLAGGHELYGAFPPDNPRGDTYGPVAYAAYVPFELLFPWTSGTWDDLPAAHAAAIAFDLGCALLLWRLGRRLGDGAGGLLLPYLWMTFPFTLVVANSGANDALVALLVLAALLAAARPAARGALVALAGLTKFAPLALAPLFAGYRPRRLIAFTAAFAAVVVLALAPFDLSLVWERTLGFQQDRDSPFSVWGYYELPGALQVGAQALAAAFAIGVAFLRPSDPRALAALAAAVLIALQLAVDHWFYLYLVWFAPLVWIALLTTAPDAGSARSTPPAAPARATPAPAPR
jgi:Glycosyltransferase family 87